MARVPEARDRFMEEILLFDDVGQKLLDARLIDQAAIQKAEMQQKSGGGSLVANLIKVVAITEDGLTEFLSTLYRVPSIDLKRVEADPACVKLLPADVALKFMALPISRAGRRLTVAMANPTNIFALDDIKFITGFEVEAVVATEPALKRALDKCYDQAGTMADVMKGMEDDLAIVDDEEEESLESNLSMAEEAPIVKLVNSLIADAVRKGASDIHIEPYEKTLRVRFRIDGTLYEMMAPPFKFKAAIISRLKIMSELDIAERRVPQDGRIEIVTANGRRVVVGTGIDVAALVRIVHGLEQL